MLGRPDTARSRRACLLRLYEGFPAHSLTSFPGAQGTFITVNRAWREITQIDDETPLEKWRDQVQYAILASLLSRRRLTPPRLAAPTTATVCSLHGRSALDRSFVAYHS